MFNHPGILINSIIYINIHIIKTLILPHWNIPTEPSLTCLKCMANRFWATVYNCTCHQ